MIRCPVCGSKLDLAEMGLSDRQRKIRDSIEQLRRETSRWPHAKEIGVSIGYSERAIRYELSHMERIGVVCRPSGPRSGWALRKEHLTVIKAA